jgi:hypothetical protein
MFILYLVFVIMGIMYCVNHVINQSLFVFASYEIVPVIDYANFIASFTRPANTFGICSIFESRIRALRYVNTALMILLLL